MKKRMNSKLKAAITIGLSTLPFLIGVLLVGVFVKYVFKVDLPANAPLALCALLIPLVAIYGLIYNDTVLKIINIVVTAISLIGGLFFALVSTDESFKTFESAIWVVALNFQIIGYNTTDRLLYGKNDVLDLFIPLINFAALTVIGMGFSALGYFFGRFFSMWLPWILAVIATVIAIIFSIDGSAPDPTGVGGGGGGSSYSSGGSHSVGGSYQARSDEEPSDYAPRIADLVSWNLRTHGHTISWGRVDYSCGSDTIYITVEYSIISTTGYEYVSTSTDIEGYVRNAVNKAINSTHCPFSVSYSVSCTN